MHNLALFAGIALAFSSIGFIRFIWFISIGYAFSIAGLAIGIAVAFRQGLSPLSAAMLAVMAIYALRLGFFLSLRELNNGAYKRVLTEVTAGVSAAPLSLRLIVWPSVAALYLAQVSPLYFRLENGLAADGPAWLAAGLAVSTIGLALQAVADAQKASAKKAQPGRHCDVGLYRFVRCPNYLGEILVWTGVLLGSGRCLRGPWQIAISALGYLAIVFVMLNGARRLERRQEAQYGQDHAYRRYADGTPIILPFLPLYSLARWRFLG